MVPSYWERYRLLRSRYPHHMRLSCLLNASEFRHINWDRLGPRASA